jgi:6-phosphofructokinase 1
MVIVCEGAVDEDNKPIRSEYVREILESCGLDARVTQLGHIQRGGAPSAYDRYLATLQGLEAVKAIISTDPKASPSLMIGIKENRVIRVPLMECVDGTRLIANCMRELHFPKALQLRGPDFRANYEIVQSFYKLEENLASGQLPAQPSLRIGILNCGAPAGGINAANRAIILTCLFKGYTPIGIFNGFAGMLKGDLRELTLKDGPYPAEKGGSFLGMNRTLPSEDIGLVAYYLQKFKIDGLIMIGGFEAFSSQLILTDAREQYPAFDIPIVVLPATISNNVPGTDFSVGCDTALNIIVQSADNVKQSASSSRKRVFVVDVQGGYCGYLATIGGLASGGTYSYIHEEGVSLADLCRDIEHLKKRFIEDKKQGRLILRNEFCSKIYSAELISKIFENESEGLFDARWVTLGHLQQGGSPSPLDRIRASRLAVLCVSFIESIFLQNSLDLPSYDSTKKPAISNPTLSTIESLETPQDLYQILDHPRKTMADSSSVVIGIRGPSVVFTCCKQLLEETDLKHRRPLNQWWLKYRPLSKILARYDIESD